MKIIETVTTPSGRKRKRVYSINEEPSKTDQSWHEDTDVNNIMRKFKKTGQLTHLSGSTGVYADVSEIDDLLGSIETVQYADKAFQALPAKLRDKFQNSPHNMIEYLQDPKNDQEAISLGLKIQKPSTDLMIGEEATPSGGASSKAKKLSKAQTKTNDDDSSET